MYQIIWGAAAKSSYKSILEDLFDKWSIEVVLNLDEKVTNLLEHLCSHKHLCPIVEKDIRKCVIHKNTSLLYSVDEKNKSIILISFFYNRSDHKFY